MIDHVLIKGESILIPLSYYIDNYPKVNAISLCSGKNLKTPYDQYRKLESKDFHTITITTYEDEIYQVNNYHSYVDKEGIYKELPFNAKKIKTETLWEFLESWMVVNL